MKARGGDGRELDADDNDPFTDDDAPPNLNINSDQLRSIVDRIESLESERATIAADIKEIKKEAKDAGFLIPVINFIIKERKQDPDDVSEFNTIKDTYRRALEE